MRLAVLAALVASLSLAACKKASREDCDKGCRNYFALHYWEEAEAELAAAPEAEREALRAARQADFEARLDANLPLCIQKCMSGAEPDRPRCWAKATTTAEARACN